ncbi:unnamed protein product [Sphacelaria rigidula]
MFGQQMLTSALKSLTDINRSIYDQKCQTASMVTSGTDCERLKKSIDDAYETVHFIESHSSLYFFIGAVCFFFGAMGLMAACKGKTLYAKVFMFGYPFLIVAGFYLEYLLATNTATESHPMFSFWTVLVRVYYLKVAWSFYHRLKMFDRRAAEEQHQMGASVQQPVASRIV